MRSKFFYTILALGCLFLLYLIRNYVKGIFEVNTDKPQTVQDLENGGSMKVRTTTNKQKKRNKVLSMIVFSIYGLLTIYYIWF